MDLSVILAMIVISSTIWVSVDAGRRGASRLWAVGVLLLWIVVLPLYLLQRDGSSPAATTTAPPDAASDPGWHPDPWKQADLRYWDGERWTGHTAPRPLNGAR